MGIRDLLAKMPKHAPDYVAWVHSLPSAASGQHGVVAHHRIGNRFSQSKVSDYEVMPLTTAEHVELHQGLDAFQSKYGTTEYQMIFETLMEAIRLGVLVLDKRAAQELS